MKVLALDIGSAQIKAVILETKFGRFDIVFHDLLAVEDALSPSPTDAMLSPGQLAALKTIYERHGNRVDRVIINSPNNLYSTRYLQFPFKDKKKVRAAINFAIEDEIPFNIDDCTISSMFSVQKKSKESAALIAISPNSAMSAFVAQLHSAGIDPEHMSVDQAGFWHLLAKHKSLYADKGIAIINLGHRKSQLMLFRSGNPVLIRTTMVGGYHLTAALAKKYEISLAEAEVVKRDQGFFPAPGQQLNNDQKIFADTLVAAFQPVLHDFDQSLMAYSSRYNESIQQIYLTGASASFAGLVPMLSARWDQKVSYFSLLTHLPNISIRPQPATELSIASAACLALTQTNSEFSNTINLRTGKFKAQSKAPAIHWASFVRPMKLAACVYVFALLSFIGQYFFLNQQIEQISASQDKALTEIFGKSTASFLATLKSSDVKLKQQVQKKIDELATQLAGGGEIKSLASLDILENISRAIPKSTTVEIRELSLTAGILQLRLESPNQKDLENSIRLLGSTPRLSSPQAAAIENGPNGRKKVSVTVKVTGGNL